MAFETLFRDIFEKNNLENYITDENIRRFEKLTEIMLETNQNMNITAITELEKVIPLHYADCVKVAEYIPQNATVLDVGCGGGYPILPLAIVRPDLRITGLDSTEKKIKYVQKTADLLGLHVQTMAARAEDVAKMSDFRENYDVVIGRAVARLNVLDELCLPFVKIGGRFMAMKGLAGREEYGEAVTGVQRLGGELENLKEYELALLEGSEKRTLITIRKIASTPREFPRTFGAIKKKPL
jgi:16S rRNA (guanine527-N7)-methyltransferase